MFCVDDSTAAAIRRAYEEGGELSAAVELRRYFPRVADNANARRCARIIAGWTLAPVLPAEGGQGKRVRRQASSMSGKRCG
jgi:hypothetical protein